MIRFSMISETGERTHNEDSVGMIENDLSYCFVLADGLGGHGKGEAASELAVQKAVEAFVSNEKNHERYLREAFELAQTEIFKKQKSSKEYEDMKTTMVILQIQDSFVKWGHIGDSRLYFFKKNKLITRTLDHSVPQILVASGQIKEKDIRHHPDRNRLLKVLGVQGEAPRYEECQPVPLEAGEAFLLCSDGFWEWIDEKKILSCLKQAKSPEEWISNMRQIVIKAGSGKKMDNFSAIAVFTE